MLVCRGNAGDIDVLPERANTVLMLSVRPPILPELDRQFIPAVLWNQTYRTLAARTAGARSASLALEQPGGTVSVIPLNLLPESPDYTSLTMRYAERLVKFLLWQRGGSRLWIGGAPDVAAMLARQYAPGGEREFDDSLVARKIFLEPLSVRSVPLLEMPLEHQPTVALGRHLKGCRIGFDLGGSDRKTSAVIDGTVVFTEEVPWDPYFQEDPNYHLEGIRHSLRRAAEHLPRVDAIGGSAAGTYVNNEVRAASLFRGISEADFSRHVRGIFHTLQKEWPGVPFEVINDGEVTALAGSMSLGVNPVLGISMGTSTAAGYVDANGHLTTWLNELAFAPVDYHADAPMDEWSKDRGCGVQYFSQQGAARLATTAGLVFPTIMPLAERLVEVQQLLKSGDDRAASIYRNIGTCFGYALAHYAEFMPLGNVLVLGRVTSGEGGEIILAKARELLSAVFPNLSGVRLSMPDEKMKRHGQAVAAASLPPSGNQLDPGLAQSLPSRCP